MRLSRALVWMVAAAAGATGLILLGTSPREPPDAPETAARAVSTVIGGSGVEAARRPAGSEPSPEPALPLDSETTLAGTLSLRDSSGMVAPVEDGTLVLVPFVKAGAAIRVAVSRGEWSTPVDPSAWYRVESAAAHGRAVCLVSPRAPISGRERGPVAVTAAVWDGVSLRVRAEDTGDDLEHVEVLRGFSSWHDPMNHPGDGARHRTLASDVVSPVWLDASEIVATPIRTSIWARSPGYAWGRLDLLSLAVGERLLVLRRGGGLVVTIHGLTGAQGTILRIRRPGPRLTRPWCEIPVRDRVRLAVDSLEPGDYDVTLEIGTRREPTLLARASVEVTADAVASVELHAAAATLAPLVPLSGTLVLPAEWGIRGAHLEFVLLDRVRSDGRAGFELSGEALVDEGNGSHRWDAGLVQPGAYVIREAVSGFRSEIDVSEGGAEGLRIEIPPPARMSIRVVDETTGEDAAVDGISWCPEVTRRAKGDRLRVVRRSPDSGLFEFRAPVGTIMVRLEGSGHLANWTRVENGPGATARTVTVSREGSVLVLVLMDGETEVAWDDSWHLKLRPLGGDGRVVSRREGRDCRVTVDRAGRYAVEIRPPLGYETPAEVVVDLSPAEPRFLMIALERAPDRRASVGVPSR